MLIKFVLIFKTWSKVEAEQTYSNQFSNQHSSDLESIFSIWNNYFAAVRHRPNGITFLEKKWHLPVWLSCDVLRLRLERPTIATILAPILDLRFLPPVTTVPTAVSDWLPSFFSMLYISPITLVLFVMFFPEVAICLLCSLDVKTLWAVDTDK